MGIEDLFEAIRAMDREKISAVMEMAGLDAHRELSDDAFAEGIYKAVVHLPDMPAELRLRAMTWLREHHRSPVIRF